MLAHVEKLPPSKLAPLFVVTGGLVIASQAQGQGLQPCCPVKADVKLQFNVNFGRPGGSAVSSPYKAPWYLYFPVDPYTNMNMNSMASNINNPGLPTPNRFPNWPCQFPPPDAGGCDGNPLGQAVPSTTTSNYPIWPAQSVPADPAPMASSATSFSPAIRRPCPTGSLFRIHIPLPTGNPSIGTDADSSAKTWGRLLTLLTCRRFGR